VSVRIGVLEGMMIITMCNSIIEFRNLNNDFLFLGMYHTKKVLLYNRGSRNCSK